MSYPGQGQYTYGGYGAQNHGNGSGYGQFSDGSSYGPPPGAPGQYNDGPGYGDNGYSGGPAYGGNGYNGGYNAPSYSPPQGFPPGPPQGPPPSFHQGPPTGPRPGYTDRAHDQQGNYGPPAGGPPTHMQQSNGMQYQYSDCSGRRKALLIGINYFNSKNELRGCINDANAMKRFLMDRYGYKDDDMVLLTDDQKNPRSVPTKANMLQAMQWLVRDARPNDTLFFHYSGHGGQTADTNGDEDDGYDETIYPVDFQQAGNIVDDVMHDIMIKPLPPGVRLTCLFDSCHSGTVLDLPFVYSTKGVVKEPNMLAEGGKGALQALAAYGSGNTGAMLSGLMTSFKKVSSMRSNSATKQQKSSPADVILISGSRDDQTSADAQNAGMNTGAMSFAFITVLSQGGSQSYVSLLNAMRASMQGRYTQKPQLSASHPMDMNLRFIM